MGKIRVKTLGDDQAEKEDTRLAESKREKKAQKRKEAKETEVLKAVMETKEEPKETPKKAEKKTKKNVDTRSKRYKEVKVLVDRTKKYSVSKALELLPQVHLAKFDETVELHINTIEPGISGNLTLPHGTGKKTRVVIATEEIIAQIEKGKIEFDILVTTPDLMPKLAKVAKVLGPRGLMPNPKNGTITTNPEEMVKKYEGGQIRFKTESKTPIIHLTVGKLSFGNEKLSQNIDAAIKAIQVSKIKNATLKSTMSPGIKIEVASA